MELAFPRSARHRHRRSPKDLIASGSGGNRESMTAETDDASWARSHLACFQVAPLVEMRGKEKVPVGFTVDLYAGLPLDQPPGEERMEQSRRLWERLRAMVESLAPAEASGVRVEVEPWRTAAYLRPENQLKPEVGLRARVFHAGDFFKATTADERAGLTEAERKLITMGLRAGHW